jgi:hypothetical protein
MTNRFEVSHSTYGACASREILQGQIETAAAKLPRGLPTD